MKRRYKYIVKTHWDSKVFGMDTYEIRTLSRNAMEEASKLRGHFTIKVDPRSSKKLLHEYGFYYCDTLIGPYCSRNDFVYLEHEKASIARSVNIEDLIAISHGAFHGRFHRDFNISKKSADLRYDVWLKQLHRVNSVFGLMYDKKLAGFFGFSGNRILLHALAKRYRGKGLSKYLWSAACKELFNMGYKELVSSISVFNAPAVNLYSSLGFRFRNPIDVYHKLTV